MLTNTIGLKVRAKSYCLIQGNILSLRHEWSRKCDIKGS